MSSTADEVVLRQGHVVSVSGARVGVMRIWEDDHSLPDGTVTRGVTAKLAIAEPETIHVVGVGSELSINGAKYSVVAIASGSSVTLRRAP